MVKRCEARRARRPRRWRRGGYPAPVALNIGFCAGLVGSQGVLANCRLTCRRVGPARAFRPLGLGRPLDATWDTKSEAMPRKTQAGLIREKLRREIINPRKQVQRRSSVFWTANYRSGRRSSHHRLVSFIRPPSGKARRMGAATNLKRRVAGLADAVGMGSIALPGRMPGRCFMLRSFAPCSDFLMRTIVRV